MADDINPPVPPADSPAPPAPPSDPPPAPPVPPLSDVDAWKAHSRTWEKRAKEQALELEKLRATAQTDGERAIEAAKAEVRAEYDTRLRANTLHTALLKGAAGRLADPEDAITHLGTVDVFDAEGHVNAEAVRAAVDALLTRKPYLAAGPVVTPAPPPPPSGDQGPRGASGDDGVAAEDLPYEQYLERFHPELVKAIKDR